MQKRRRPVNGAASRRRQRGVLAVSMPFTLLGILAVGAVALDMGHLFAVQSELQTAADAAALAGARSLNSGGSSLNWSAASAAAASAVALNSSDGTTLHDSSVQTGFWNLSGSPSTMQASTITPQNYDMPGLQVTVSRAPGLNGGPVSYFLAPIFGMSNGPVTATSVAVMTSPGAVTAGALFPIAIGTCIYNQYWNFQTGSPKLDPATGKPYTIYFGDGSSVNGCQTGQWTSFQTNANDVPTVRGLIANGNPTALSIGNSIWIQSGVKNTIYNASIPTNVDVLLPVVSDATASTQNIVAFAAFHIDLGYGGSTKYIQGHFVVDSGALTQASGVGPTYYGAYLPPRLAN